MGCISSKILTRSGSLQEKKASSYHGFQRSSSQLIEDIILSSSNSKTNGDQPTFLALLRTTSSSSSAAAARKSRVDAAAAAAEQSPASAATPAAAAKIETIDVSELLAGLEEEDDEEEREEQGENDGQDDGAAAAGTRARSFRTVEDFDALVNEKPERDASAAPPGPPESGSLEQEDPPTAAAAAASGHGDGAIAGAKRRARARQLRELSAQPEAAAGGFDFGKSGSLRDWLRGGGQIFSPGSYVTPKFGNATAVRSENAGEEHAAAVFDPELVAQLELAMEELSVDEERVMREVLESLDAGEKKREEAERLDLERPLKDQALPLVA
ncbi:uncharacterized protein LOC100825727 [Brachypodium distachyon]|uniref:Uncharacterized protein n=1 Tax=Brachypodium distachyon TaxID=15368 RepID=I1I894_BRADI|nr:uncharacterized protein LOC100825727 [Brachypodium distachyon]XP_010235263.1 uncharacterized protein LOC100825727 [Brachypodium distachyon]KQJ98829.1 hypothetical protein BRADI_3g39370v3 [Brachypodium distachyon]|eukprot:XP_003572340.1 uncharacterized protein LOC100825727 [Brachypodium distachyon]